MQVPSLLHRRTFSTLAVIAILFCVSLGINYSVKPLITDPPKSGQPLAKLIADGLLGPD